MIKFVAPQKATGPGDITLMTAPGRRLTKLITEAGIDDYEGASLFEVDARRLDGVEDLAALLEELATRTDTCIIRACLKRAHADRPKVLRRIHDHTDPARPGRTIIAPFEEARRQWTMLDVEPGATPAYVDPTDPVLVGGYLRRQLPPPFPSTRCVVQLSSGAALKPGLRAHLWFWLDRPLGRRELDQLLGGVDGIDTSTFRDVQIYYTGSPCFDGVDDPCTDGRLALLPGRAEVEVGELPAPRAYRQAYASAPVEARAYVAPLRGLSFRTTRAEAYMLKCLQAIAAAPPGKRHPTIVSVSARLFGLAKAGVLDPADVSARVQGAVGLSSFDRDRAEVISALRWAWTHADPWNLPI